MNTLNYEKLHTWLDNLESGDTDKYMVCTVHLNLKMFILQILKKIESFETPRWARYAVEPVVILWS